MRHTRGDEDGSRFSVPTRIAAAVVAVGGIAATAQAGVGSGDLHATVTSWFGTTSAASAADAAAIPAPRAAADDAPGAPIADADTIASLATPAATGPSAVARAAATADTVRGSATKAVDAASSSVEQVQKAAAERARAVEAARAAGATGSLQSASAGGAVSIVTGRVTSGFGSRWGTRHMGLDIAAPIGTPIHVPLAGTVISSGPASGFGMWVRVRHADGTITVYGHINRSLVSVGQTVAAGQQIAEVGNRGQSTGPHLHIEVVDPSGTKINPKPWLDANGFSYT
ncbi:M23 family metallopeptidase [Pseudonocardia spirodelae]|uniref:M23 family metallopeptidase n=1 Tax=Pseudonocardia spirodelae TaxID=3133431 RepID=A0ABU8T043_9PSEU